MKTWDDWSDFEVNYAVADACGMVVDGCYGDSDAVAAGVTGDGDIKPADYCNNWADIGPLIQRELITLDYLDGFGWTATPAFNGGSIEFSCYASPLRAAAIVFLMMKGVKPCSQ